MNDDQLEIVRQNRTRLTVIAIAACVGAGALALPYVIALLPAQRSVSGWASTPPPMAWLWLLVLGMLALCVAMVAAIASNAAKERADRSSGFELILPPGDEGKPPPPGER